MLDLTAFKENLKVREPERYAASLKGSIDDQKKIHCLYALNYEISKAAWVSREPIICKIRLQWWKDSFENASVINSLDLVNEIINMCNNSLIPIKLISEMIDARYWDISSAAFVSREDQDDYINKTYGNLFWIGAQLLGAEKNLEDSIRKYAYGAGVSAFLLAAPMLISKNNKPFLANSDDHIKNIAKNALLSFKVGKKALKHQKALYPILLSAWQTEKILVEVIKSPIFLSFGHHKPSGFERTWQLMWKVIFRSL